MVWTGTPGYGFNPTSRAVASFDQLQHYPYGFNSGTILINLLCAFPAAGCVNIVCTTANGCGAQNLDLTTKDSFLLLSYEKLL